VRPGTARGQVLRVAMDETFFLCVTSATRRLSAVKKKFLMQHKQPSSQYFRSHAASLCGEEKVPYAAAAVQSITRRVFMAHSAASSVRRPNVRHRTANIGRGYSEPLRP